ncbi:MAG: type II toxin-antitoxin system VapC family toxin [Deltaproteobacteria bacterium]|nr:type II toxin-antitoxin system VapC family toxin [Deltaproteobacteria bacterium]
MIVLDASAAAELVLRTPTGARVAARLAGGDSLHAPHLVDLEVGSVLRRLESSGSIAARESAAALVDFLALDITRYPHELLMPRIWQLRGNLTTYDGCYVALAEVLRAPLVTCDAPLAHSPGHRARIELI